MVASWVLLQVAAGYCLETVVETKEQFPRFSYWVMRKPVELSGTPVCLGSADSGLGVLAR